MNRYINVDKFRESINKGQIVIDEKIFECETIHDELVYLLDKVDRLIDKAIDEQPTADVVEASVRCRDCAYYIERQGCDRESQVSHYPPAYTVNFEPDDFCSYGKRKDDNEKR